MVASTELHGSGQPTEGVSYVPFGIGVIPATGKRSRQIRGLGYGER